MTTPDIRIKRVYEDASPDDRFRVLVDRLWPRGVSHERAALDGWAKEAAPSPELRTWWDHDPARMEAFAVRYRAELAESPALAELRALIAGHPVVTLVYAAHDPAVNHAIVLRDVLLGIEHDPVP